MPAPLEPAIIINSCCTAWARIKLQAHTCKDTWEEIMQTNHADTGLRFREIYRLAEGQGHCFNSVPLWLGYSDSVWKVKWSNSLRTGLIFSSLPSRLQQTSADRRVHEMNVVAEGLPELFFWQQGGCLHREWWVCVADAFLSNEEAKRKYEASRRVLRLFKLIFHPTLRTERAKGEKN